MIKYFRLLIFALALGFGLQSCKDKVDTIVAQKAEVMKIHDDAMARLGEIRSASKNLTDLALTSGDSLKIKSVVKNLETADEAMMEWMAAYVEPEADQMPSFLADQKIKITKVAELMYSSLDESKPYLNE